MQIDEFESQFKSALKAQYEFSPVRISSIALVSGQDEAEANRVRDISSRLLPKSETPETWHVLTKSSYSSVQNLLSRLEEIRPDLIIAERDIDVHEENLVYGLSNYVDALTQVCASPVLLLPSLSTEEMETSVRDVSDVMVETNHLTGDSSLINWGLRFVQNDGTLFLVHIEDDKCFRRYIDAISKIPEIDTDLAERTIREELLKLPSDFIENAKGKLTTSAPRVSVKGIVRTGHRLDDYRRLLDQHQVDLLIVHTKIEDQLAMSGLAYSIAVEFKHKPLLLL